MKPKPRISRDAILKLVLEYQNSEEEIAMLDEHAKHLRNLTRIATAVVGIDKALDALIPMPRVDTAVDPFDERLITVLTIACRVSSCWNTIEVEKEKGAKRRGWIDIKEEPTPPMRVRPPMWTHLGTCPGCKDLV